MTVFPNTFAAKCIRCGGRVEAEQGTYRHANHDDRKLWPSLPYRSVVLVEHIDCAAKYRSTDTHWQFNPIKEPAK